MTCFIRNHESQKKGEQHFKSAERKDCQPRILSPGKIFFRDEGELKTFSDEGILNFFCPAYMFQENWERKFLRKKGNDTKKKVGSSRKKERQQK